MAEDVAVVQDKAPNACCAALKKKHSKLLEKYSKLEEIKNKFRDCTALVQEKYDVIEKENVSLKKAHAELKAQASVWKDEKEKEYGIRVDLEDEVSALKDEVQLLKQNGNSYSHEANEQLQERLNVSEKEIKRLKELLDKERRRAALEKKNAELEKKKADEALKQLEMQKNKVSEAQKVADVERKRADENRLLCDKLTKETNAVKSMLDLEKSKVEVADKKVEAEKQNAVREKKRADLAVATAEERRQLAETNLKKAKSEKDRADDLNQMFEESRNRAKKLEELCEHLGSGKLVEPQGGESNTGRNVKLASDGCLGILKNDGLLPQWMEKVLLEKEQNIIREKKRASSEKKRAKKQRQAAEDHKKMARQQKHRADQLSSELESYKLRLEELQKELERSVSYRKCTENSPLRYNNVISETDMVKLLKNQLKLEKMLLKHAKKESKLEAVHKNMLHQELFNLKQECLQFQQRLDILDDCFLHSGQGMHQLEKIGNQTSRREILCSDGSHRQLISGIHSGLDPPCKGYNQKVLQSSAINSSSASFSDRPLVGSQERGISSTTTSAKLGEDISNLKPTLSRLPDKSRIRYNEHDIGITDSRMRSPVKDNANERGVVNFERKRIFDAVLSVENLHFKGKQFYQQASDKLSILHGMLNCQKDEPEEENLEKISSKNIVRHCKRRKTSSCEGKMVIHRLEDSMEPKSTLDLDNDHADAGLCASPREFDLMQFDQLPKDGTNSILRSPPDFDKMTAYDCLKLLEMDNAADENSYCRAIAMPLSPTLPNIKLHGDEKLEGDNSEILADKSSLEGLRNVSDNLVSTSSFHVIGLENNPSNVVLNGLVSSRLQTNKDSTDIFRNKDSLPERDICFHEIHFSGGKSGTSDLSGSGNKETNIPCEGGLAFPRHGLLKYYVVSSENKDNDSFLRILRTIGNCMPCCSSVCSAEEFLQSILHALLKAEDVPMKEKVCVFFSLVLNGIFEIGMKNLTNVLSDNFIRSLDSVTLQVFSALVNPVLRRMFMEACDLFELLAVVEDFLLQGKVFVFGDFSAMSEDLCSSKVNLVLNGNEVMLSEVVASAHQLVAGASLLASLCLAVDHIGCVCEVSCNIITIRKFDPTVVLAVLHAFAHACGSKYFTHQQYSLAMIVIKSLVVFLERQTSSASFSLPTAGDLSKIWLCSTNCPFSEGAISVEDVALLLLENLHVHSQSEMWPQDSLEIMSSLVPRMGLDKDRTEEVLCVREALPLNSITHGNFCNLIDILSLIEILASFMTWDWTFDHIVGQICEFLESRLMEGFSAAIIVLLGQLGRLGVGASGYEEPRVKKLREWLTTFLCKTTFMRLSLPVQFAIVTSLFGLTPIKFEEVVEDKVEAPAVVSLSIPTSFIREWFFLLNYEQQSLLRHHQATCESNYSHGSSHT